VPCDAPGRDVCQRCVVHVLVVEDDDAIAEPLARGLERQGWTAQRESTGLDALAALDTGPTIDLILLDLGLPDIDGYEVCRRVRARSNVPIIVLTARGDEIDRVLGLELGADDYVVKPFGFRELVARMNAVLRRSTGASTGADDTIHLAGGVVVDTRTRRVTVAGTEVVLTRKEFDLLALLGSDPGATFTRESILEQVWDAHWYGPTKTLDVHIAALRKKLGDPSIIETVRGVGFRTRRSDDTAS
jgi:two-component system response regulator RegX3